VATTRHASTERPGSRSSPATCARAFYERAGWVDEGGFDYEAAVEDGTIAVLCRRYTKLL
jgi:hypothetical protein